MSTSRDYKEKYGVLVDEEDETIVGASNLVAGAEAREQLVQEGDTDKLEGLKSVIEAVASEGDAKNHEEDGEEDEPEPVLHATGNLVPAPSLARQGRLGLPEDLMRPGAYRVRVGEAPDRANSTAPSDEQDLEGYEPSNESAPNQQPFGEQAFLVEATLVDEEGPFPPVPTPDTSLLVPATSIRRARQVTFVIAAMVVTALIVGAAVGLVFGLARNNTQQQPETFQFEASFRATLPPYTLQNLENTRSPQYRAFEWILDHYQLLGLLDPQNDELYLRATQRFALATLYFAMGGEVSWNSSSRWLSIDDDECSWHGCCCDDVTSCISGATEETGTLKWLDLSDNGLMHSLPKEIGLLTSLRWFLMSNNTISGSIPTELGLLSSLVGLQLDLNALTSTLPTQLGFMTKLLFLDISQNELLGSIPIELGQLTELRALSFESNQLTSTIPTQLGLLTRLTGLWMYENAITGSMPPELGNLFELLELNIRSNRLNSTLPTQLVLLTNLMGLSLSDNHLTGSIPTELGQLSALTTLYLDSNRLTGSVPTELGELSSLEDLVLYSNQLNSTIPSQLGNLANLEYLSLRENRLIGSIPTELGELSALTVLNLWSNQLTSSIPTQLSLMTNLNVLWVHSNEFTGSIPTELGQLSALESMWISSPLITSTIPTHLGLLSNLTELALNDNRLTGPIPIELSRLSALSSLWLNSNQLSSTIPTELGLLSNLDASYTIRFGNNNLSGSVPSELCQLRLDNAFDLYVDCQEVACACSCSCSETAADDTYYGADDS
jgi:Leucine-rich repeat (LRR) protein